MKKILPILLLALMSLSSCGVPMSYLTSGIRTRLESKSISMEQLQFYVDEDVELRRELASGEATVTSGKVKIENGKSIHIIKLRRLTPGVCVGTEGGRLDISFEAGDGKHLTFGLSPSVQSGPNQVYQIYADEWIKRSNGWPGLEGKITYDGETYFIQPSGAQAKLMIQKSVVNRLDIDKRVMKGRKL